jgi:hypothetical protein
MDVLGDLGIFVIHFKHEVSSHLIKDGKDQRRLFSEPNSQSWVPLTQMEECDLKTLLVVCAKIVDPTFIDMVALFVNIRPEELSKYFPDPSDDLRPLDPQGEFTLNVFEVKSSIHDGILLLLLAVTPVESHSFKSELSIHILVL